jgi:uncharacterized protein DUF6444
MAGSDWTVAPNQTMLCDDVARPQYHKARLGTRSSGSAHSLLSLQQQGRLLLIRCAAYEKEIAALRQQATQIDDLKAEMAELRERLRQNSQNSSNVGGSDSLAQAIPTQLINIGRVEAHEQPCSIHFGNRLLRPAAGL